MSTSRDDQRTAWSGWGWSDWGDSDRTCRDMKHLLSPPVVESTAQRRPKLIRRAGSSSSGGCAGLVPAPSVAFMSTDEEAATVLGLSRTTRALLLTGGPLLGLVLGYYLPTIAAGLSSLPWIPMRGPLRLIAAANTWWALSALMLAGTILGLLLAHAAITESLRVTVTNRQLRLERDGKSRAIDRSEVSAVFVDGPNLVVLDRASRQLVRERHDSTAGKIAHAVRAHGYPWTDRDPYEQLYRRWIRDSPDLPGPVNAVLAARETALRKKARQDVDELRVEIQNLGFVIRDEGHRQYWRPLVRS